MGFAYDPKHGMPLEVDPETGVVATELYSVGRRGTVRGDMHLHTHCVVPNLMVDGEGGDSTQCRPNQIFAISLDSSEHFCHCEELKPSSSTMNLYFLWNLRLFPITVGMISSP